MEAVALIVLAASIRLAWSGNRPAPAEALVPAIAANAMIHTGSSQRSRRSPSRTRAPVPASVSPMVGLPWAGGGRSGGGQLLFCGSVVPQEEVLQGRGRTGQ